MAGAEGRVQERRSLKYIRLAAHLAQQSEDVHRVILTIEEVEGIVGDTLPSNARFPSWWRNDPRKMHSRAWLTAGWEVDGVAGAGPESTVVFVRRSEP